MYKLSVFDKLNIMSVLNILSIYDLRIWVMKKNVEHKLLLREGEKIVEGLGQALSPLCEVVLHDLRTPDNAIVKIENNLSGRAVGGSATELGLARIADSSFPDIVANYANQFSDGRAVKSTSIGLKDSKGNFVAAICLNIDISYLQSITSYLGDFTRVQSEEAPSENLGTSKGALEAYVQKFASKLNKTPTSLSSDEKRNLLTLLMQEGHLEQRGAADRIAALIGGTRSGIYYYMKNKK